MREAIPAFALFLFALVTGLVGNGAFAAVVPPPAGGSIYLWPIELPITVTSSFGEFRPGHFHGGIDLSTQQKVGREVHAIGDGRVWRVRASGAGYGRALYFRLSDGRTAVFAHLNAFAPAIAAYVEAAQESLSRYEVDLYPPAGRLPFHRGDVIAWSGESGAGPPHLHFEIREGDDANTGVNPLDVMPAGFATPDTITPVLSSVTVEPYGADSRVDGSTAARTYPAVGGAGRPDGGGAALHLREKPRITGAALLTVRAFDPSGTGNRLSPYLVSLSVDGEQRYLFALERFQWEKAHEVELAYDYARARAGDDYVLKLYRPIGASNIVFDALPPGRLPKGPIDRAPLAGMIATAAESALLSGGSGLAAGEHQAEVLAADEAGNEARLEFSFTLEAAPAAPVIVVRDAAAGGAAGAGPGAAGANLTWTARTNALDIVLAGAAAKEAAGGSHVTLRTPLGSRTAALRAGARGSLTASVAIPEGLYMAPALRVDVAGGAGPATSLEETLDLAVVTRGPATVLRRRELTLDAPARAFFGPGTIRFRTVAAAAAPELEPVGNAVALETGVVCDHAVTIRLEAPAGAMTDKLGLYRRTDDGGWSWVGNTVNAGGLSGETRYLTTFALFRDTVPPRIGPLTPAPGQAVTSRPEIFAGLDDRGSGFTWREIEATIDGVPQIVVYDPESGTLRGRSRRELESGPHTLTVTVHDLAGNVSTRSAAFRVK